jgi:Ser/Thr protein kinase RdoA (MazF antagonist)
VQNDIPSTILRSALAEWRADLENADIQPHGESMGLSGALVWRVSYNGIYLCLKRWPKEHPSPTDLSAVHDLLQHVTRSGCQIVPAPLVTPDGRSFLRINGFLWDLTPWLPGEPYNRNRPNLQRRLAAMRCLAQFHLSASSHTTPTLLPAPGLLNRREILRELRTGRLEQLRQAVYEKPASELRSLAEAMLVQIERRLPPTLDELEEAAVTPLSLQWCIRDVKCDHILFMGEQVTGLIDFGAAAIDSVAGDVARLAGSMVGDDRLSWAPVVEAYSEIRPLSPDERCAIDCYDRGGTVASAANWIRWLFKENRVYSPPEAVHEQMIWLRDRLQAL